MYSIYDLNLEPEEGKVYWNSCRDPREEIIYFLMVDRFHDGEDRIVKVFNERSKGFGSTEDLRTIFGGKIKGITGKLNYLQSLGITAIWLSPVFENNSHSYHGYAIENFLNIDPRFGTLTDLKELIQAAHGKGIKVYLDVVINHSGDNWYYRINRECWYNAGTKYPFGAWRKDNRPLPIELRDEKMYFRKGMIQNWDDYPETQEGDFFSLKKFRLDQSDKGVEVQDILTKIHCWWIKETDCDGFRMDAVKHIGEKVTSRFATNIKEYCKKIGKKDFFIFGELAADDEVANRYVGMNTSIEKGESRIFYGLDSILDFPLHFILPKVVKGMIPATELINRYKKLDYHCMSRSEAGKYLVTFLDNHDQIESTEKFRFGADTTIDQIIAAVGLLYSLPGIPCIYYGTEQGLDGSGKGDESVRESMFDKNESLCVHNENSVMFRAIAELSAIRKNNPALSFGRLFFNEISKDGRRFSPANKNLSIIAFSRRLFDEEVLIVFNVSKNLRQAVHVKLANTSKRESKKFLYGKNVETPVRLENTKMEEFTSVFLELDPLQLVILK